ncbi:MAG: DNA methylase [Oscillospiraceae bacterium]|nr:DNA methylase [Oscillospiraceae bacterium]
MKTYACIDLKSFYASVECVERGLDPMNTNLLVADSSRTEKTICLAVTPSLKKYGISGRARLFEVNQRLRDVNNERKWNAPNHCLTGESYTDSELCENPSLAVSYITAPPRMAYYMKYSTRIYEIYLKYFAPEDIHIYSIDEVFIDVTSYLKIADMTAKQLIMTVIQDILNNTGITATAGIGTNLYLCKIAMDIVAKHIPADKNGVRIAELDEMSYRRLLWGHRPITDFWRIGKGYAKKLEGMGLYTMGDVARFSLTNDEQLYKIFGVNAELLIDHAWGCETCTIKEIKAYIPENTSISSGQVLSSPYPYDMARLVIHEMADALSLDLVDKKVLTNQIVLNIGYDIENVNKNFRGEVKADRYGRAVPKEAHGSINFEYTSSSKEIVKEVLELFDSIVNRKFTVRRMSVTANHLISETEYEKNCEYEQLDLFSDYETVQQEKILREKKLENERHIQEAVLEIKKRYGKNAVLKGMNLLDGATAKSRNKQIGGHKA